MSSQKNSEPTSKRTCNINIVEPQAAPPAALVREERNIAENDSQLLLADDEWETVEESVTSLFCAEVNSVNNSRTFVNVYDIEKDRWFKVTHIKQTVFRTADGEVFSIIIDIGDRLFIPPTRQKQHLLKSIFGLDEDGNEIRGQKERFKAYVNEGIFIIPNLKVQVKNIASNGKRHFKVIFSEGV